MRLFITGGAGFIGCNSADHFLGQGHDVVIYDNLSRAGGPKNLDWLRKRHGQQWRFIKGDVRDTDRLAESVTGADAVLHLASQVAVTTSVIDPREDFEINALGTFNVLEAVRLHAPEAAVLFASSNKVYGGMESVKVVDAGDKDDNRGRSGRYGRYAFADFVDGIPENFPLDFHSPYGCSKGAGDQYTIDYARIFGLRSVSLRQSCIYGRRQFGVEDQGWVAHFVIAASLGRSITIYGDGRQVRDLLHVSDLVRAYEMCIKHIDKLKGLALNLGGGPQNTLTIWSEFGPLLESLLSRPVSVTYDDWRPGDQKVFVANIARAANLLGWRPTVSPAEGIADLFEWVQANKELFGG
jgi:CDP-paratose 2-epimerase